MPHYLDNIWGDQQVVRGFGDALNNNFAALVEARTRQRAQEQNQALNAAYLALERQKQMSLEPGIAAEARVREGQAQEFALRNAALQQQMRDMDAMRGAAARHYMAANPAMQPVPPPLLPTPTPPMMLQSNIPMPQQVPSTLGPGAPTIANANQLDEATIRSILAMQMAQTPQTAGQLLQGNILRPGEVQQDMISGRMGEQVPGYMSPAQLANIQLREQSNAIAQQRADTGAKALQDRENKPETFKERLARRAAEREKQQQGGRSINPVIRRGDRAAYDALPPGARYQEDPDGPVFVKGGQ